MQKVRSKFIVCSVDFPQWTQQEASVELTAVSGGTPENERFSKATPDAKIKMWISNPSALALFEKDREFYVDFVPVEQENKNG